MREEVVSLSRQTSVSDFSKSSSGTCASPPELLDIGDDCPDDPTTAHEEALSPEISLLFHICYILYFVNTNKYLLLVKYIGIAAPPPILHSICGKIYLELRQVE
jgi:hypothetical protein